MRVNTKWPEESKVEIHSVQRVEEMICGMFLLSSEYFLISTSYVAIYESVILNYADYNQQAPYSCEAVCVRLCIIYTSMPTMIIYSY